MPLRWAIGYGVLTVSILGFQSTSAAQGREASRVERAGATVSVAGCLFDERTYATARGLVRFPEGAASGPQLVLVPDTGARRPAGDVPVQLVYALTGVNEAALASKVGTHVELTGVVETAEPSIPAGANQPPSRGLTPPGAVGVTPGGSPAHEPSDALAGAPALEPTAPAVPDPKPVAVSDLTRLNVRSSRSTSGSCPAPVAAAASAGTSAASSQPVRPTAPSVAAATPIEVTGCLSRSPESGGAFVLHDVAVSAPEQRASAVPGSSPSGSGSGTVPATAPTGTSGSNATVAFTLVASNNLLDAHVGRRVRVAGTIDNARSERGDLAPGRSETAVRGELSGAEVAHPSAQPQELRVRTVADAGGRCN